MLTIVAHVEKFAQLATPVSVAYVLPQPVHPVRHYAMAYVLTSTTISTIAVHVEMPVILVRTIDVLQVHVR